jgi:carbonic anhydrase/acetyltransferase-like protein (isoleucine patch superfamily)
MISCNTNGDYPQIDKKAYLHPTAIIIGKVKIGNNVFIGPGAVVRADEPGSSITIEDNCNIQDRVIIHSLGNSSVFIGRNTSLAHGCVIHGPCKIGEKSFIGFGSVIFSAEIGRGVCVKHLAVVENIDIPSDRIVESGRIVNSDDGLKKLSHTDDRHKNFMREVIEANLNLVKGYNSVAP